MADILIRGMEMPKDGHVIVRIYANGDVCEPTPCPGVWGKVARVTFLPEGHGRLGDLDALQEEFKKSHDGKRLILIDTAPTIIEADLEWKMKNCCCFSNTDQAEGDTE